MYSGGVSGNVLRRIPSFHSGESKRPLGEITHCSMRSAKNKLALASWPSFRCRTSSTQGGRLMIGFSAASPKITGVPYIIENWEQLFSFGGTPNMQGCRAVEAEGSGRAARVAVGMHADEMTIRGELSTFVAGVGNVI